MQSTPVFIVIPNYNNVKDLQETVRSFQKHQNVYLEIVVVDNGSTADVVSQIQQIENIHLILNNQNLGWAVANNVGIKDTKKQSAEHIIFANNDIIIDDTMLINKLIKSLNILNPKLI